MSKNNIKNFLIDFLQDWKLLGLLGIAVLLAIIPLITQTFFYYDQARDAYEAYSIWHNHDFKILGPGTDIPGLFHGVIWYYLLGILYFIAGSDPQIVTTILFVFLFLTVPFIGYLAAQLFHDRKVAWVAMALYAFSPLFQLSTRWLSNPTLGLFVTPFLLLSLFRYRQKNTIKWALLTGILLGVLVHSNTGYLLIMILIPIHVIFFRLYKNIKSLAALIVGFMTMLVSFVFAELKFNGQGVIGAIDFLTKPKESMHGISDVAITISKKTAEFFSVSVLPFPDLIIYVALVALIFIIATKRQILRNKSLQFILLWLPGLLIFLVFNTGISRSLFVFFPFLAALVIGFSYVIVGIFQKRVLLFIVTGLIISFQIFRSYTYIHNVKNPLTVQIGMTLPVEKQVIDYTYRASGHKPFTINTVTSPLYINTTWAYLYNFYALPKYSYLPFWDGKDQTGRLGNLPRPTEYTDYRFLIVEPSTGIPDFFITQTILEENQVSKVVEEKQIGNFKIQKRLQIKKM